MKKIIFIILFTIEMINAGNNKIFYSLSLYTSLSHTGYALIPAASLNWKPHSIYLGPKICLSGLYLPEDQSYGVNLGYRFNFIKSYYQKKFNFFINMDYQLVTYEQKSGFSESAHDNYIHELNLSYGIQFRVYHNLYLGNSIGIGKYWESYFNNYKHSRVIFEGYDNLITLSITYVFTQD